MSYLWKEGLVSQIGWWKDARDKLFAETNCREVEGGSREPGTGGSVWVNRV